MVPWNWNAEHPLTIISVFIIIEYCNYWVFELKSWEDSVQQIGAIHAKLSSGLAGWVRPPKTAN